ncbi:NADH dehydrogenase 1 alpha subcomplex assembly factor 3 [Fomitopsis serialis]|uniref:NADH dehydrogenase 1 alpha subcomplex assembly factor 3 n=1 Tax=Fomitopsis serialis TaxID=139415 RepID=UPI0020078AAD|nr:NADH dehydrogenase 1 alpha subcomplex assembly factor 3 [Neoantrodia serialis]KAH9938073.1 NADH dehydrogenase 1 alpha subcomplex assembly factor 3 [Neoantrodia serialis]
MSFRLLANAACRQGAKSRPLHSSSLRRNEGGGFSNMLAGGPSPTVQVKTITNEGIELADGLIIPGASIFLDGKVFLWDVPEKQWEGWDKKHFGIFDVVVPKPELLLFGTGKKVAFVPPMLRQYISSLGIQVDVMDTWNACSTYNMLAEEGRQVAAALLPLGATARPWRSPPSQ